VFDSDESIMLWTNGLTERMRRRGKGKTKSNGTRMGHGYHSKSDNGLSQVTGAGTINKIRRLTRENKIEKNKNNRRRKGWEMEEWKYCYELS
jgi:hypothetical protein